MVKICPQCGTENDNLPFWCSECNTRLIENIEKKEEPPKEEKKPKQVDSYNLPYSDSLKKEFQPVYSERSER